MTNPDYTHLLLVVDRSGSMDIIASDMNGAIKALLKEQAAEPGQLLVDAWVFDEEIEKIADNTAPTDPRLFHLVQPRWSTALNDAIGRAVTDLGEHLAAIDEARRPGKVVVVIVTDGYENASKEWTASSVKRLVSQQQDEYGWQFVFLGANIDAFAVGDQYGVPQAQTMNYAASGTGVHAMASTVSGVLRSYRGGAAATMALPDDAEA